MPASKYACMCRRGACTQMYTAGLDREKDTKQSGLQGLPSLFAGVSNWRLLIQVVINIKAGDNVGKKAGSAAGERCRLLRPLFLIYKHLPGTVSLPSLHSAYIPRNFK